MTAKLIHKTKGKGIQRVLKNVKSSGVKVGILKGTGEHPYATKGQTIAEIAWWNEFGTSIKFGRSGGERITIPERPFLRSTMRENEKEYFKMIKVLLRKMATLDMSVVRAEGILGSKVQADIQNKITELKSPPNAPSTIERKGSSNPLIDTGQLRQHISWVRFF